MNNQMTPTEFHDRLDVALRDDGEPATSAAIDGDMLLGRKMLRRRRTGIVAGTVSLVAATVLVGGLLVSADEPAEAPGTATAPSSNAELLAKCRDGDQSTRATRLMFGAGDPEIKVVRKNPHQTVLALEAADGRHWAQCRVDVEGAEFPTSMEVYDASKTTRDSSSSYGTACPLIDGELDPECKRFSLTVVDRRPAEVAAVEFWTADGERTVVESVDGYIVLSYVGDVPGGGALTMKTLPQFAPMKRITFLDSNGTPIAAEAQDGSGSGPDRDSVDGLPSIKEFPSLRASQAIY